MARTRISPVRVNPVFIHPEERRMSLDGSWDFRLDPEDKGKAKRWFAGAGTFKDLIKVPGCWQGQGFGGDGKDLIRDFKLEARTFRATYKGTGWYSRHFKVPAGWREMRIQLNFGGVHPSAEVWLNGTKLGENNLPFVPFGFEVTDSVLFDRENRLVVRVHEENRILGLAYNWQGNWSGLYRGVELTATGASGIESFRVYPDVDRQAMRFKIKITDFPPAETPMNLQLSVQPLDGHSRLIRQNMKVGAAVVECELPVPSPRLWSPDAPNLYRVDAVLKYGERVMDALSERTGFVKLSTNKKKFLINDEPYYMRGSGDFMAHPETGCPDTDRERWRKKLAALRVYGYNHVRCQSYTPSPEYFDAADEVGLLVQSEMGMLGAWGGTSIWHVYGWPKPTPDFREILKRQWDGVVRRDVNHPSANLYCMSNELGTNTDFPRIAWQCYRDTKALKPTAFIIWTDGGYNKDLPGDFVNAEAETDGKCEKPVIQHEYRWWSSFPDVRIRRKYSGAIRPYGADIALEAASRQGQKHLLPLFAENSQRLQYLEAKAKMEACRRDNPNLAGISHFSATDFNPSPQGIINEFYEQKYANAATWLQINGDTVVLSSFGFDDRIRCAGETVECRLAVSDFSHPPFVAPTITWRLTAENKMLTTGRIDYAHQPYRTCPAGEIKITIPAISRPLGARLEVTLHEGKRKVRNSWNLWLFPSEAEISPDVRRYGPAQHTWLKDWTAPASVSAEDLTRSGVRVVLTEHFDDRLAAFIHAGGRVILAATEEFVRPHPRLFGYVKYFFTPPANYAPYEDGQNGTIILKHPMLGDFPHEGFADFQFFRLMEEAAPLDLGPLDLAQTDPVIRVIHRYPVCRPLGYMVERSWGKGGIILIALNLDHKLPEARYLLGQVCRYAAGEKFRPKLAVSEKTLRHLETGIA